LPSCWHRTTRRYLESGPFITRTVQAPRFDLAAGNFWYQSGQNGNPVQAQVASVNYANYPTGSSGHTIYVFGVTVPIDSSKTVQAVVLPKVNGSVAGYQAALHIFALGL
jgi:hypothetical protein